MNKSEYDYLHGYQDKKDAFDNKLEKRSLSIYRELWDSCGSISEALSESLSESKDYAAIVRHCYKNKSTALLGEVTIELISIYLSEYADELAEEELT